MGVPKRHLKAVDGSGFAPDPWEQRFRLLAGSVRALVSVHNAAGAFVYASPLVSDLVTAALLATVIAVSWVTYSLVERPARSWSRRVAPRIGRAASPLARASA